MWNQPAIGKRRIVVLAAMLFVGTIGAFAQGTAGISGVVEDATGAVVQNASITATQTETSYTAKTTSGATGEFTLTSLPVGPYNLSVTATGFAPYTQKGLILVVAQVSDVHVTLKVGGVSQQVEVAADQATVQTSEATVQSVVPEQIVSDMPLNGRQTNQLLFTVPGVSDSTLNVNPAISTTTGAGTEIPGSISPSTHGVVSGSTYFSLDGANNIDPYAMLGAPFPNPDATQEFNVATSAYSAQYMSAPGGAISVVSKSGTNSIHGSAFEYIRNGYFNADQWGSLNPDELKRNQFGGSIGGPILKKRLFVFGSYQYTLSSDANAIREEVPTDGANGTIDQRSGTFGTIVAATGMPGPTIPAFVLGTVASFIPPAAYIPASGLSTVTGNLIKGYIPEQNVVSSSGVGFYEGNIPTKTNTYEYLVKVDYDFGSHRVFGRYFRDHNLSPLFPMTTQGMAPTAATGGKLNLFTATGGFTSYWETAALGDTWMKKTWVLDTRASFNKGNGYNILDPTEQAVTLPSLGAVNFNSGLNGNEGGGTGLQILLGNGAEFTGISTSGDALPRETWDLSEAATAIKGKHEISFGGSFRYMHYIEVAYVGQQGVFVYAGVTSNILTQAATGGAEVQSNAAMADFLMGSPIQFTQHDGFFVGANQQVLGFYAEDKYRVTPRFTLTGGVRWDPFLPIATLAGQMTCWNPGEQSTVFTNAPVGLTFPGDKSCYSAGTPNKIFNIQPRVGFAYDVFGNGKTAVRGGYGIYYLQEQLQIMLGMSNPPWIRNFTFTQPFLETDNPWASAGVPADPFAAGFHAPGYIPPSNVAFPATAFSTGGIGSSYTPGNIQQWTLSVQQGIGTHDIVQAAYVATKGTHLGATYDENLPTLLPPGVTIGGPGYTPDNARRPDQSFTQVAVLKNNAGSNYNGLEASWTHQMKYGLFLTTSYTWSKCLSEASTPAGTGGVSAHPAAGSNVDSSASLYGLCSFDQNYIWRTNANWRLPSLSRSNMFLRETLGGWAATGLLSVEANTPFTIIDGNDLSGSATFDRADVVTPAKPFWISNAGFPGPKRRLNYSAFQDNESGTYGDSPIQGFRDVGHKELDMALMKDFPIIKEFKATFRAEVFNLANHANYTAANNTWSDGQAAFGQYTGALPTRVMQFALRLQF